MGYDEGKPNGKVLTANISKIKSLNVSYLYISDLTGIEDFSSLTSLSCYNNQLTSLNVTQNTALISLDCSSNQLTNLDVTQNTLLVELDCHTNLLKSLDVTQNTELSDLYCDENKLRNIDVTKNKLLTIFVCNNNEISGLDVSKNSFLIYLCCFSNQLSSLNLQNGNNENLTFLFAHINPNLTSIVVDNVNYSKTNWTNVDPVVSFSSNNQ
ncbi:MAG: hypothetical protein COB15_00785 [Flavobacteriales bacterium]|nr:MAG: hypothetical protein COB15_00785 [Flavobacteriales bacterium]